MTVIKLETYVQQVKMGIGNYILDIKLQM